MAQNGRLPDSDLAPIAQGRLVKANYCAASWNAMNVEARALGVELVPTGSKSSYRTYDQQVELYHLYQTGQGALAAVPGSSNHGMGLAVDVATQQMRSIVDRIGRKYGWAKEWSDAPSEWWHLKYRAGVWSGPDPGPSGQPPQIEEEPMIATAVAQNGNVHVFRVKQDGSAVEYTWKGHGSSDWSGEGGGYPAGMARFAAAPEGHPIAGIVAVNDNGVLTVLVRSRVDGSLWVTWQAAGQTSWAGGQPGQAIAAFSHFAAKP